MKSPTLSRLLSCAAAVLVCAVVTVSAAQPSAERKLRVVVFGAHPDDPESGAGGLIATLTRAGHEVICAYAATHRADRKVLGGRPEDPVRRAEAAEACKVMGATPHFFPYGAENFWADSATLNVVGQWLDSVKPDFVVAHWPFDTHPNHTVVGSLAWLAYKKEGGWNLYFYEVCTEIQSLGFRAELYLDIEPVLEIKKKALFCHVSQDPPAIWRIHEPMQLRRGKECGRTRAEAYFLVEPKKGCPLLPVPFIEKNR